MKIERPETPEEAHERKVREIHSAYGDMPKSRIIRALAQAMLGGQELAVSEQKLGSLLILAAIGHGDRIGEPNEPAKEYRLVLKPEWIEELQKGRWAMTHEVTLEGQAMVKAIKKQRGTLDVPESESIAAAEREAPLLRVVRPEGERS